MSAILLVHGAWPGGRSRHEVATRFTGEGHLVFTPTLTGMGERSHLASPDIDLNSHIVDPLISPDPYPASVEERLRAIGKSEDGRYMFAVSMFRTIEDELCIRPISARYMHRKETESHEQR